ncbi:IclR family transcriptional regulator [Saccharopolyspora phatthalungensis]|uniref:DNA-binding IclR family transcriptional regulator n=1 Tax=Saccharopolyspora phatthalungensis TaxID=664693 RepID=A0A840QFD6_9PSEU|nr:IclR family transcriptional regulator [Saccharopolyspora phatthalungensis]MBB5157195.1 DNA-binding IclR family transcriptional regulator [Saccharopolyspora phatthalungensis]
MAEPLPPGPETVLGKTMKVLGAFTADDAVLGFTDLQLRTELPKATLHRLLGDLVGARLLEKVDGAYRLSRFVFELGMRASVERTLLEVAIPFLEELYERTHETVHLGVREGHEVVYVAKMGGHRQVTSPSRLGGRMPLHATAIGKALLAWAPEEVREDVLAGRLRRCSPRTIVNRAVLRRQLDDVLERGVAFEHEESAVGVTCVAAPVLGDYDEVLAGVSVTGPVGRFEPIRCASAVRAAAAGVAATLARRSRLR